MPWWIIIAHEVARATSTSLPDIGRMPALDVLLHARAARQFQAADRAWSLRVQMFRHMRKTQQSAMLSELSRQSSNGRLLSAWDQCQSDDEKLRLVGCSINAHGIKWLTGRTIQLNWLHRHGYTPDDALASYERWEREYKNKG